MTTAVTIQASPLPDTEVIVEVWGISSAPGEPHRRMTEHRLTTDTPPLTLHIWEHGQYVVTREARIERPPVAVEIDTEV